MSMQHSEDIILLAGEMSVGKSTFIAKVLELYGVSGERPLAGRNARGTTKEVTMWPPPSLQAIQIPGLPRPIRLIDVPGLGDMDARDPVVFDQLNDVLGDLHVSCVLFMTGDFVMTRGVQLVLKWLKIAFPEKIEDFLVLVKTKADVWEAAEDDPGMDELLTQMSRQLVGQSRSLTFKCHIGRTDPVTPVIDVVNTIVQVHGTKRRFINPSNMFLRMSAEEQIEILKLSSSHQCKLEATKLYVFLNGLYTDIGKAAEAIKDAQDSDSNANLAVGTSKWATTIANIGGAVMLFTPLAPAGGLVLLGSGAVGLGTSVAEYKSEKANANAVDKAKDDANQIINSMQGRIEKFAEFEAARSVIDGAISRHGLKKMRSAHDPLEVTVEAGVSAAGKAAAGGAAGTIGACCEMGAQAVSVVKNTAFSATASASSGTTFATAASSTSSAANAAEGASAASGLTEGALAALPKINMVEKAVQEGSIVAPKALSGAAVAGRVFGCVGAAISVVDLVWWHNRGSALADSAAANATTVEECGNHIKEAITHLKRNVLVDGAGRVSADLGESKWLSVHHIAANSMEDLKVTIGSNQTFTDKEILSIAADLNTGDKVSLPLTMKGKVERNRTRESKHNMEVTKVQKFEPLPYSTVIWQLAIVGHCDEGAVLYKTAQLSRKREGERPQVVPVVDIAEWYEMTGALHVS